MKIATRTSPLALWQAHHVAAALLVAHGIEAEIVGVSTGGDRHQDVPLSEIGGKGVFVTEVQAAVLDGRADVAVHSAKDMPAVETPGLRIPAFLERADPRDAVVGAALGTLADGAIVATGSPRRQALIAHHFPRLRIAELRGNIATRLSQVGQPPKGEAAPEGVVSAIIVAAAALDRLGLSTRSAELLDPSWFIPQVGQGIVAVEARAEDTATLESLQALDHAPTRIAAEAERAFLAELGGDCRLPAAAHATWDDGSVHLTAMLTQGVTVGALQVDTSIGTDPGPLGRSAAQRLLGLVG
jgi:hydroxymethylbilane synthase